jgi:hypothetical protein
MATPLRTEVEQLIEQGKSKKEKVKSKDGVNRIYVWPLDRWRSLMSK